MCAATQPLNPSEEQTWRALVRLMVLLPRVVDEDLARRSGISLTRYVVLMRLSEAPGRSLRMSDLADAASLSPSRITRIVQAMVAEGLLTREVSVTDARASLAILTDKGLRRLQEAWPHHLAGVRALVLDHIDPAELPSVHAVLRSLVQASETAIASSRAANCPAANCPADEGDNT